MRYIHGKVTADLAKKMVFVGGPRQAGKTTLAKSILAAEQRGGRYLNWDYEPDRDDILRRKWADGDRLLVFDEVHKFPQWRNHLKGIFDVEGDRHSILVTGSARLDVYRRGGDSLFGRYHYWRLHPFSIDETPEGIDRREAFRRLMSVGGFPEPFLDGDETAARRWRKERFDRILREDVRDLESIRDITSLGLMVDLLRRRVGSPTVISHIAGDLRVSPTTAAAWLQVLERMYLVFVVRPHTRSLSRAVQKPPKVYFFDTGDVIGDDGARFENFVACTLLKRLHFVEDGEGRKCELRYIRDKEGREVDFAVVKDDALDELVEAKYADEAIDRNLSYYAERLGPRRATQVVATLKRPFDVNRLAVRSPIDFFEPLW